MTNAQIKRERAARNEMFESILSARLYHTPLIKLLNRRQDIIDRSHKLPQYAIGNLYAYHEALLRLHSYQNTTQAYYITELEKYLIIGSKEYNEFVESIGGAEMVDRNYDCDIVYTDNLKPFFTGRE